MICKSFHIARDEESITDLSACDIVGISKRNTAKLARIHVEPTNELAAINTI